MKTLRFTEYYLPNKKVEAIENYTRNELYRNIYSFMNMDGFTNEIDYRHKLGPSPMFNVSDLEKVYHDLEMSDEAYDVINNLIKKNIEKDLRIEGEIKRYGSVIREARKSWKFHSDLLPKSQKDVVEKSFNFCLGTIKRGSEYLSFIQNVSILVEGEWTSVENEYKYTVIK